MLYLGIITASTFIVLDLIFVKFDVVVYTVNLVKSNIIFWKLLVHHGIKVALYYECQYRLSDALSYPIFIAGGLQMIRTLMLSPHQKSMRALTKGQILAKKEISETDINRGISRLGIDKSEGIALGISKYSGKNIIIPDYYVNQVVLVLGTTGSGKTVTLEKFYHRAIAANYPLIIVTAKPSDEEVSILEHLAKEYARVFYPFNTRKSFHYDSLASGGYTELKDKIISLKDHWESDYYLSISEDYLQTTLEVLLKYKNGLDLKTIAKCLNFSELAAIAREVGDKNLLDKVKHLQHYDKKELTGLQAHLNLLIHSELGQFLNKEEPSFNLADVIAQNGVVYFALSALRFPSFSKVLGKLIINDIKAVVESQAVWAKRIFTVFDEFSVFAGEQVLNLINMGRGKGVHAVLGTQGLADLKKVSPAFESQILNCVNTVICHRLNDQESAEKISTWIGTAEKFDVTAQVKAGVGMGLGSVSLNRKFIVHPDEIKQDLKI